MCKDSTKKEVCTLDRTHEVLDTGVPEGTYGIAMECGKEDLKAMYELESRLGSDHDDLHEQVSRE